MITLHGEEVKVGDKVWHVLTGWGEVVDLVEGDTCQPICVRWGESYESYDWFTEDGKFHEKDRAPMLFWQPIEFEIPKKPKPREKAWQWICLGDVSNSYWITPTHYTEGEEVLEFFPNAEPIEPYLPSEIEIEVRE